MMKLAVVVMLAMGVASGSVVKKRQVSQESLKVWSALDQMRGSRVRLEVGDMQELYKSAKAGQDYPNLSAIPDTTSISCATQKPGFYADTDPLSRCQVIRRCDINGNLTSYLCPNMTIFNQITLICDWFFNVDCNQAKNFYDYSNSRLYQPDRVLLDNQDDYQVAAAVNALPPSVAPQPAAGGANTPPSTGEPTTEAATA
ncbi:uncharacterized protein LOC129593394 [Paramacrobiotus metropolitanus]|uniref:uncharacterized protein LOC129593394 n=1 Tax=Paramacrobiotus metropolitanus TaxID=2943436 RepID=UPI0024464E97|nr:uncharacterized protein LOC129593394 [Paramacrobiotus metropolitanus]